MDQIPNDAARRLFLNQHGLGRLPVAESGLSGTQALIEKLGFVQVDSIATVERAHHMILWSRMRGYRPSHIKTLLERKRSLFEHWTHDAAIIPTAFYPYWKLRFRRDKQRLLEKWRLWRRNGFEDRFDEMLRRVAEHGSTMARDVGEGEQRNPGEMWDWHPSKTALEFLWRTGALAICHRDGFQKCFDLAERVVPAEYRDPELDDDAIIDWACRSALDRLGFATSGEIAAFWDLVSPAEAQTWCQRNAGESIIEVPVGMADGSSRRHYAWPGIQRRAAEAAELPGIVRILSPFDPALRNRKRAAKLFGFDYRIEIFVPAAKRRFGYYVFPVLEGDHVIGRIDMKRDLQADVLNVTGYWPQRGFKLGKGRMSRLSTELERVARFAGCSAVDFAQGWKREPV